MELKLWLREQGVSVRELALQLDLPRKTVEDWVYRGAVPCPVNMVRLNKLMACKHHWVIEAAHGPLSEGVCQRCGEKRKFENSAEWRHWFFTIKQPKEQ